MKNNYSKPATFMLYLSLFSVLVGSQALRSSEEPGWRDAVVRFGQTLRERGFQAQEKLKELGAQAQEKYKPAQEAAEKYYEAAKKEYGPTLKKVYEQAQEGYETGKQKLKEGYDATKPILQEQWKKVTGDPEEQARLKKEQMHHVSKELIRSFKNRFALALQEQLKKLSKEEEKRPHSSPYSDITKGSAFRQVVEAFKVTPMNLTPLASKTFTDLTESKQRVLPRMEFDINELAEETEKSITSNNTLWQGLYKFITGINKIFENTVKQLMDQ